MKKREDRQMTTIAIEGKTLEEINRLKNLLQIIEGRKLTTDEVVKMILSMTTEEIEQRARRMLGGNDS